LVVSASGCAMAGTLRDCVIDKGAMELSAGQLALLKAHGDGQINIWSTINDNHLDVPDGVEVHRFMWSASIDCVLNG
ncbi:MAG: hypothetical protein L3J13_06230, partial [Devosiaceae bacterium]|nr:hypothetical protein [Devosiaceae bacterium]